MSGTKTEETRNPSGTPGSGKILAANRLVLLVAVPLFLVLAVVAYLTIQFAVNERGAQGWVRHTYEVMEATRALQNDLQIAETSQRGYLLDRDPTYLEAYQPRRSAWCRATSKPSGP